MTLEEKLAEVKTLLTQLSRGTHDPMPTRRIHFDNPEAMNVDAWWQNYFTSLDQRTKEIAREALSVLQ